MVIERSGWRAMSRARHEMADLVAKRGALCRHELGEQPGLDMELARCRAGKFLDLADHMRLVVEAAFDHVVDRLGFGRQRHRRLECAIFARQQLGRGAIERLALPLDLAARRVRIRSRTSGSAIAAHSSTDAACWNAAKAVRIRAAPNSATASTERLSMVEASPPIIAAQPAAVSPMPNSRNGPPARARTGPQVGPRPWLSPDCCTPPSAKLYCEAPGDSRKRRWA